MGERFTHGTRKDVSHFGHAEHVGLGVGLALFLKAHCVFLATVSQNTLGLQKAAPVL